MKRALLLVIVAAVALSAAWTAFAVEPLKLQARLLKPDETKLPVAVVRRLQTPPGL